MAYKLPGIDYTPKVQQSSIKLNVTNVLYVIPANSKLVTSTTTTTAPVTFVGVNVELEVKDIEKSKATITLDRLFTQIVKMANGNQPETPPMDNLILEGKIGGNAVSSLEVSIDGSEVTPVCSIRLNMQEMRFDLLKAKLDEVLLYVTDTLAVDI